MSRSIKPKSSIDKKIEACEKAVKEDSILGAYHKMVSCVADLLNQYAEQWVKKQHPEYSELYYHGEINKRKIINEALKTQ